MIARIAGRVDELTPDGVLIDTGAGICYEVLAPACDLGRLSRKLGQDVVLHTIHYMEGDPTRGQQMPRLAGFLSEGDRTFFRLFTTVKGVGIRKALRAMARPIGEIAAAIQAKDVTFLKALPEIGARTAEHIIADLTGKIDAYAVGVAAPAAGEQGPELPEPAAEAIAVLVQLGERRADATALIERVLSVAPELKTPEEFLQHAYRLKAGGR